MTDGPSTVDVSYFRSTQGKGQSPGIIVVFSNGQPCFAAHAMRDGELEIGRSAPRGATIDDRAMSRRHARIRWQNGSFEIEDLGSRNGLVVDGVGYKPTETATGVRVLRLGQTVVVLSPDISSCRGDGPGLDGGMVVGPRLREAWRAIDDIASNSSVLHLRGESGVGKEAAAERFHHASGGKSGAFIPVNCAAVPAGVAERLLFGAKKGAFSGAHSDAEGFVQAAHGGTLFLDEIGELELDVQAKLLRVLESRTVTAVGDTKSKKVEFRLVSATHKELRQQITERTFREDLFYRVGRPEVVLPSLRDRPEDIPYLAQLAAGDAVLAADFIEQCLMRPWPGNVRELLLEVKEAVRVATADGAEATTAAHLSASAGAAHAGAAEPARQQSGRIDKSKLPSREVIEDTLRANDGKVATAARALGVHRNQLRRWLKDNDVDPASYRSNS